MVQRALVGVGVRRCGPRAYESAAVGPPAQPHRVVAEKRFGEFAEHYWFAGTADGFCSAAGGYRCWFEEASAGRAEQAATSARRPAFMQTRRVAGMVGP